jgi:hypothetical protein
MNDKLYTTILSFGSFATRPPGLGLSISTLALKNRGWRVRLVVNNYLEDKESSNVIGVIRGEVEPDRYVIVGEICPSCIISILNVSLFL